MNLDDVRVALTVVTFFVFVGIAFWAYSRRRRRDFDEAANLPFTGHDFGEDDRAHSGKENMR